MNTNLNGKVVVITGGTFGIGRAAAELFLKEGCKVVVCGSRPDPVAQLNREALQRRVPLLGVAVNVADSAALEQLFRTTEQAFGGIDILLNNAGIGCADGFMTLTDEYWRRSLQINLIAVTEGCRMVIPYLRKRGGGCIINTSSLGGRIGSTGRSIYSVTKAGVNAYTRALALELEDDNIRVNAVAPGMIGTDMVKKNHPDPDDYRSLGRSAVLQRMGEPEEIAATMVFLASDAARGMTGQILEVTGGKCVVQDPDYSWHQ